MISNVSCIREGLTLSISTYQGDPILTGAAIVAIDRIFDSPGQFIPATNQAGAPASPSDE